MKGRVRGKYHEAYREGQTVKIHKMDGMTVVQQFTLEDGAVMLEPDVREYFPNSEAVNKALRCLIPLMTKKPKSKKEEYGEAVKLYDEFDEEKVSIFETDWYKRTKANIQPGENLKIYREMHGITQEKLGETLGNVPRQHVSNMERGVRKISLKTAQKLAQLFKVPVEKFL